MADPASHRIVVVHEGQRYRFARSRSRSLVICQLVAHQSGRSFWRDMSPGDWNELPEAVRTDLAARLLPRGGAV